MEIIEKEFEYRLPFSQMAWRTGYTKQIPREVSIGMKFVYSQFVDLVISTQTYLEVLKHDFDTEIKQEILEQVTYSFKEMQKELKEFKEKMSEDDKEEFTLLVVEYKDLQPYLAKIRDLVKDS